MSPEPVVRVAGIRRTYGPLVAIEDVSFEVRAGEIFGLIGPNGAGKTTTMECVEGLRVPDRGTISVLSLDPFRDVYRLQNRIGVQLQAAQLQKRITVREAVHLWASLYPNPVNGDLLLERLGLADKRKAWFMTLSGGQKQRLFIALALINDPELVFLDELTTGLDPQARHAIWDLVRDIQARGKTVFLTTHLMEEAERLCDRVAILEHGRIVDIDTPARLVSRHCPERSGRPGDRRSRRERPPRSDPAGGRRAGGLVHADDSRARRESGDGGHPVPGRAPDQGDGLPDDRAQSRGRVPQADGPVDQGLTEINGCADC